MAAAGDLAGYRRLAQSLYDRFAPLHDDYRLARACTLAPDAVRDRAGLGDMGQRAAALSNPDRYALFTAGLASLPAGRYPEALEALKQAHAKGDPRSPLGLAMTLQRQGQVEEARRWLAVATEWYDNTATQASSLKLPYDWRDFPQFTVLYAEAREQVEGKRPVDDPNLTARQARARRSAAGARPGHLRPRPGAAGTSDGTGPVAGRPAADRIEALATSRGRPRPGGCRQPFQCGGVEAPRRALRRPGPARDGRRRPCQGPLVAAGRAQRRRRPRRRAYRSDGRPGRGLRVCHGGEAEGPCTLGGTDHLLPPARPLAGRRGSRDQHDPAGDDPTAALARRSRSSSTWATMMVTACLPENPCGPRRPGRFCFHPENLRLPDRPWRRR